MGRAWAVASAHVLVRHGLPIWPVGIKWAAHPIKAHSTAYKTPHPQTAKSYLPPRVPRPSPPSPPPRPSPPLAPAGRSRPPPLPPAASLTPSAASSHRLPRALCHLPRPLASRSPATSPAALCRLLHPPVPCRNWGRWWPARRRAQTSCRPSAVGVAARVGAWADPGKVYGRPDDEVVEVIGAIGLDDDRRYGRMSRGRVNSVPQAGTSTLRPLWPARPACRHGPPKKAAGHAWTAPSAHGPARPGTITVQA